MNCVFVAIIKSHEVFIWSTLSSHYSWPQFPPGLRHLFCLHWIPCTGNVENCICDNENLLEVLQCSFIIHKFVKKILPIITFHILYNSLATESDVTCGGRYRTEIFPDCSLNSWVYVVQLSSNSMNLLSSGMPILWKFSFNEEWKDRKTNA